MKLYKVETRNQLHQLTNDTFSRIFYQKRASVDVLQLQRAFLFNERQLSQVFSEAAVRRSSLKQLFQNIIQNSQETMSGRVVLFAKNKKTYIAQRTFSSEISQIFQSSFCNSFGRLFPWKKPLRNSRPKEFLEIAVLKYLKLPGNCP